MRGDGRLRVVPGEVVAASGGVRIPSDIKLGSSCGDGRVGPRRANQQRLTCDA